MPGEEWVLRHIRGTRADPPGKAAAHGARQALYSASLEQFEQLLQAAEVVGPAARPLPLFYALSQAGRAIVAAHGDQGTIDGHGLIEDRRDPAPDDLLHRRVKRAPTKDNRDAFGAVSRALGSPEIAGSIELGACWAGLPNTYVLPTDSWRPDWRPAIPVLDETSFRGKKDEVQIQLMSLGGNPHLDPVATLSEGYPRIPPGTKLRVKGGSDQLGPGRWIAVMTWSDEYPLDKVAPNGPRRENSRHLRPTLPGQAELLDELMQWWLLIFGLSLFARYHPELWAHALAVDSSPQAVPLEAILDRALDTIPQLVLNGLYEKPAPGILPSPE
jgi:hypothetical protein